MITFNQLIIISGNRYNIRTDAILDFNKLFEKLFEVNTLLILMLDHGTDKFTIDIGRLLIDNTELLQSTDVNNFISKLTPELIYTYKTDIFDQKQIIRSFMNHDLPGSVMISPYNMVTGEKTNTVFDRNYPDAVIQCDDYDLDMVIPVIDGKLRNCVWQDGKIVLHNRVDIVKDTSYITFMSFGATHISTMSLRELSSTEWQVPENKVVILVIKGSVFFDNICVFKVRDNTLILNEKLILNSFKTRDHETIDTITNDKDSFVIVIDANRLLIRDLVLVPAIEGQLEFMYYEDKTHNNHVDYICIDNADYTVHGITAVDERYKNVRSKKNPNTHHVYASSGSGDMRLVQLAVC